MSECIANNTKYNNNISGLNSLNVQDAIDEQGVKLNALEEKLNGNIPVETQSGSYTFPSLSQGQRYQHLIQFKPPFKNIPTVNFTHGVQSYLVNNASVSKVTRSHCIISITSGYSSITPVVEWTATEAE